MPDAASARSRVPARSGAKLATGKPRRSASAGAGPLWRWLRRHPGPVLISATSLILMGGITGNAVLMQKGHHPAPLFGRAAPPVPVASGDDTPTSVENDAAPPEPPLRPAAIEPRDMPEPPANPADDEAPTPPPKRPVVAKNVAPAPVRNSPGRKTDGITTLLGPETSGPGEADVRTAQKALVKLGYRVSPDGRLGTATREALEDFAKSRHIKDGSEVSPKLLRALAAAAHSPG